MTTPQPAALPELPEPDGFLDQSLGGFAAYTADQMRARDAMWAERLAALQAQPAAAGVSDAEWWHDVLGLAGPDLLNLAKQWSDNEVHVYQFVNEAEKIVKAAAQRAILALRPQADHPDSYEDIWQALMDINTVAVMLPEFNVRHEGGIKEATKNIVEAIEAASLRPQAVPMTDEQAKQFLKRSDLLDMFLHIGWYSAPRKGFDQHALSLIRAVEAHHGITAQGAQGGEGK